MKQLIRYSAALAALILVSSGLFAQCTIDSSYTSAGIYPDTLPDATAGDPYNVDVTFVMVTDTMGLTIYSYQISAVSGLPVGLTWQCNNFANGCIYDPSVSIYGCVNISGTPVVPGSFIMTVTVLADVQLVGVQAIDFDVPLTVNPSTVTNPGFSMQNASGCEPLTVTFINNNPGQASYQWDFGNGIQSNLENPPPMTYNSPGVYVVTQTVTPNVVPSWYLTDIEVTSIPDNYGGFIDDPDLYFLLYDTSGTEIYDSHPALNGVFPPVNWGLPNIPLDSGLYTVHVWDEDGGLFGADDDLGEITFNGHGSSGTATGTVSGATGILIVNYTIFQTPVVPLTATDTIYVYAAPPVPSVTPTGPIVICADDTLALTANDTINMIQWYDSWGIIAGETQPVFIPGGSGDYHVTVTTPDGCTASSSPTQVTINPLPVKPTFFVNGFIFTTGVTGLNFQWYLNGNSIPGATGSSYTAQQNGTYQLCGTDANGCTNCSDTLAFMGVGIAEASGSSWMVYPNPGNGNFTIEFTTPEVAERRAVIFDISGRKVEEFSISSRRNYYYGEGLPAGSYILEIKEGEKVSRRRLIVN